MAIIANTVTFIEWIVPLFVSIAQISNWYCLIWLEKPTNPLNLKPRMAAGGTSNGTPHDEWWILKSDGECQDDKSKLYSAVLAAIHWIKYQICLCILA